MRSRHPVRGWLIAAALVLIGGGALVALARPIAHATVSMLLERAGIPVRTFKVKALRPREAEFGTIELGLPDGPAAASARATWTVRSLVKGHLERLIIRQPRIEITATGETIEIKGLPGFGARESGGAIPIARIDVLDGTLKALTPFGTVVANLDATIIAAAKGGARLERLRARHAAVTLAGGIASLTDALYQDGQPFDAVIQIDGVDLAALLKLLDVEGLTGSGDLDGQVPIHIDGSGVRIDDGRIHATGPGTLRYSGQGLPGSVQAGDKSVTDSIRLVREALADFHYTSLTLALARAPGGEGTLTAKLEGANPAVLDGHPFAINIRFDANFDKLAAILFEGYTAVGRLLRPGSAARSSR
jgi:hypothetical protein